MTTLVDDFHSETRGVSRGVILQGAGGALVDPARGPQRCDGIQHVVVGDFTLEVGVPRRLQDARSKPAFNEIQADTFSPRCSSSPE